MHFWNLYPRTACGPLRQVIRLKRLLLLSRSFGPAVIRALREIFSVPRFEEIFNEHFRRDPARFQGPLETHTVEFFVTRV
jgi:hypothetical protein